MTYADNHDQAWNARFSVKPGEGSVTLIAGPGGKVTWRHNGEIDRQALGAALRQNLEGGKPMGVRVLGSGVRVGQPPPTCCSNTHRARHSRCENCPAAPAVLIFWKTRSPESIEAVRDAQSAETTGVQPPIVIAINDGCAVDAARKAAEITASPQVLSPILTGRSHAPTV